jgi:hypothetical protein
MTDRIDHAAEAQKVLAMPTSVWGSPSEMLAAAQVHATLALAAATLHSGSGDNGSGASSDQWREATR